MKEQEFPFQKRFNEIKEQREFWNEKLRTASESGDNKMFAEALQKLADLDSYDEFLRDTERPGS